MRKSNIRIIRILILLIALSWGWFNSWGNDNENTKLKILEIKLNDQYIFGEGMSDDKEIAYGDALEDLLMFANEIKIENSQDQISVSDLIPNVETLTYKEGNRFEVIVYIPFKIIIDRIPNTLSREELAQELKENEKHENFKESRQEESEAILSDSIIEPTPISENSEVKDEIEDFLITQENFSEIKSFLSEMKQKGKILETGATENIYSLPTDASLIIIDELGGLLAFLSPTTSIGRINYKTNNPDLITNYNSKFIVWYRK